MKFSDYAGRASWKIDSEEEQRLAALADSNEDAKKDYVEFYRKSAPEYYEKGLQMIEKTLKIFCGSLTEEQHDRYVYDMIYSLHRFGCMYDEYFLLGFEYLNVRGREQFVTDKNRWEYYYQMNGTEKDYLFKSKSLTYNLFRKYYRRDLLELNSADDFHAFCAFRGAHPSFIVKPATGSGGRGIYIEHKSDCTDREVFDTIMEKGPAVIEEIIVQAPEMEALHPGSLNTVRIPTIKTRTDTIIFHPRLRIGTGSSIVDNAASGGILAPIDSKTGVVSQRGITKLGQYCIVHPDSNVVLPGFRIPKWEQLVAMVKELADVVDGVHYVGWDCALTENGWIMIEGNLHGQFGEQYATKVGLKEELEQIIALI